MRDPLRLCVFRLTACLLFLTTFCCVAAWGQNETEFSGTVSDADGQPIADAEVWLIPMETGQNSPNDLKSHQGPSTDEAGNFSISYGGDQAWAGMIYKEGFAPAFKPLGNIFRFPRASSRKKNSFKLKPSKTFSLKVFDAEKKPVEIKSVHITALYSDEKYFQSKRDAKLPFSTNVNGNEVTMDWVPEVGYLNLEIDTGSIKQTIGFQLKVTDFEVELAPMTKLTGTVAMKSEDTAPEGIP